MRFTREQKRGIYERFRKKRWLRFRNRGLEILYFNRFKKQVPTQEMPIMPFIKRLSWWEKVIFYIQKFLYKLK